MEPSNRRYREEITKEHTCPVFVFHDSLPAYLSKDIEMVQRRATRVIFPFLTSKEALDEAGLWLGFQAPHAFLQTGCHNNCNHQEKKIVCLENRDMT